MSDKYVTLEPLSPVIRMVINKRPPKRNKKSQKTQYNPIKSHKTKLNPTKPTVGWAF
jgi:hypothetical protein